MKLHGFVDTCVLGFCLFLHFKVMVVSASRAEKQAKVGKGSEMQSANLNLCYSLCFARVTSHSSSSLLHGSGLQLLQKCIF